MGKGKCKEVAKPKPTTHALKPKIDIAKEGNCFHCGMIGHWKRNCPKYPEDKKNRIAQSTEKIRRIGWRVSIFSRSRKLAKGEVDLRVDNGAKVVALVVGTYALTLAGSFIIQLENCYYVPAISRNIISPFLV
ncbi:putative retrotransposon protein [Trifolium pratense]|uniref:Putative retrotransposon protein n=1 Tax=Trifolium pratense TaxID=57577 RepID=A0A2K3P9L4_TRIPR|nr:putative retrotransposon protein [Trifolium pratense]